jgi:hypothetical protein
MPATGDAPVAGCKLCGTRQARATAIYGHHVMLFVPWYVHLAEVKPPYVTYTSYRWR